MSELDAKLKVNEAYSSYRARINREPDFLLEPELQWAVASRFERLGQLDDAIEAFARMGRKRFQHPLAADGLLRAAFLSFRLLQDREGAAALLWHLIEHYPHSPSAEKAAKILPSMR